MAEFSEVLLILNAAAALVFEWIPPIKTRWDKLEPWHKRLFMIGLALVSTAAVFFIGCLPDGWSTCQAGLSDFVAGVVVALVANQGTHRAIKR